LPPQELERLSVAAFLLGHHDETTTLRERAYRGYLAGGEVSAAVRCAFWLGFHLQDRGDLARSSGWLSTLQRLVAADDTAADDTALAGLLVLSRAATAMAQDDPERACRCSTKRPGSPRVVAASTLSCWRGWGGHDAWN